MRLRMRISRLVAALAAVAVLAAPALAGAESATGFPDFSATAWWATPMQEAVSLGIIQGVGNGPGKAATLDPNQPITRADFATMLVRAAGYPLPRTPNSGGFADVSASEWFSPYIDALVTAGIVKLADYPTKTFDPNGDITRAAMATWIGRVLKKDAVPLSALGTLKSIIALPAGAPQAAKNTPIYSKIGFAGVPLPTKASTQTFPDVTTATPHYADIMEAAAYGVIDGFPNGTFGPVQPATRAQAAKMVDVMVNELTTGAPSVQTLDSVLQGALTVETDAGKTTPKDATTQAVIDAVSNAGAAKYLTKVEAVGTGGVANDVYAERVHQPLYRYDSYTTPDCQIIFSGATVAEANCVVGIVIWTWNGQPTAGIYEQGPSGPITPTPDYQGSLFYFVHTPGGWRLAGNAPYGTTPPWFTPPAPGSSQ